MEKSPITDLLLSYCDDATSPKEGLFLLDLPTGFGKTYSSLKAMFEIYQQTEQKIVFLTNLKKNLPHEEFKNRFFSGMPDKFEQDVVFMDSYSEHIVQKWEILEPIVPTDIAQEDVFKKLKKQVEFFKRLDSFDKELAKDIRKQISQEDERKFRQFLREKFADLSGNKLERLDKIKKDHTWLIKWYPSVLSHEKRVFFMSMDKFLTKNDPIVLPVHDFYDKSFLENALIFIDEFDASKEILLNNIIQSSLQRRMDIMDLFEHIATFLHKELPSMLTQNSTERTQGLQKEHQEKRKRYKKDIPKVISELRKRAKQISEQYNLLYNIKTAEKSQNRRFLFHDWQYRTIVRDGKKFIGLESNKGEKLNKIIFQKSKLTDGQIPVWRLLNDIERFLEEFVKQIEPIAHNYWQNKQETLNDSDPQFSPENARLTFLNALKLPRDYQNFLLELARQQFPHNPSKKSEMPRISARRFYEQGYRYYAFEDRDQHDTQSKIYMAVITRTPESWLSQWAEENLIVGISATAKIETVVGNYDLLYLQNRLGQKFKEISQNERAILREEYDKQMAGYNQIFLETAFIKADRDTRTELLTLFPDSETTVNKLQTLIEKSIQSDDEQSQSYLINRILRIAQAFNLFIQQDNLQAFLCFLNTHPKSHNSNLPLNVIEQLFEKLCKKHGKTVGIVILNSDNFDDDKDKLLKRLSKGEKIFVITTYQTLGAGQNVQYKPQNTEGLVRLYERFEEDKKDFDGIYLDMPTNLLVNLRPDHVPIEDLNKRIFQVEMLAENGDLSPYELNEEIEKTFKKLFSKDAQYEKGNYKSTVYGTSDFHFLVLRQVIQAVGRIGRTSWKSPKILLLADAQLVPHLQALNTEGGIFSPEILTLTDAALKQDGLESEAIGTRLQNLKNRAELVGLRARGKIRQQAHSNWSNPRDREEWAALRDYVLKNPTLSEAEFKKSPFNWAYIEQPKISAICYYKQQEDFEKVEPFFQEPTLQHVSAQATRLDILMQIPELKEFFIKHKYAQAFASEMYILAPVIFGSIYKGAVGEVIGKYIIEKYIGLYLSEMNSRNFEKFDFQVQDREGVYIDFKLWNEASSQLEVTEAYGKIRSKMFSTQAKQVLIINILAQSGFDCIVSKDKSLLEIPRLIDSDSKLIDSKMIEKINLFINK